MTLTRRLFLLAAVFLTVLAGRAHAYDVDDYIRDWQRAGMVKAGLKSVANALPGGTLPSTAFPLLAPDGNATAPSYSFSTDAAGFYHSNANQVSFAAGGGQQFAMGPGSFSFTNATAQFGWSNDTLLFRDAAGVLAQRNSTNAQAFRVYNTFTDASNYERAGFNWGGNVFTIATEKSGTGGSRTIQLNATNNIQFQAGAFNSWQISATAGYLFAQVDNTYDIGAAGASRPRTGYFGTSLVTSVVRSTQTTAPTCTSNCGTSPSVTGGDTAGIVTMGATGAPASGWVVTFNGTWAAAPSCVVQSALSSMVVGKMPIAVQTSTTTLTVTTNGTAPANSDKYSYICIGVS